MCSRNSVNCPNYLGIFRLNSFEIVKYNDISQSFGNIVTKVKDFFYEGVFKLIVGYLFGSGSFNLLGPLIQIISDLLVDLFNYIGHDQIIGTIWNLIVQFFN